MHILRTRAKSTEGCKNRCHQKINAVSSPVEEKAPLPPIKPYTVFWQLFLSLTDFTVKNKKSCLGSLWDVGIDFSRRAQDARTT